MRTERGFTLVELIMVIVIIGILAVAALPKFYEMRRQAREAAMQGAATNVQAGIATWHYNRLIDNSDTYPFSLDDNANTACADTNATTKCFDVILSTPVTSSLWQKMLRTNYNFNLDANGSPSDSNTDWQWIYSSGDGSFTGAVLP